MEFIEAVLLTVITASTPLLLAASGELVAERAGVLNLGVEGMMIVGAACGFAGAYLTGSIAFVYCSVALIVGTRYFLYRTKAGLVLRAVGDNHASAHALGYPVLKIRALAVLFGGACAGLGGAYLPFAYTPFWVSGMTAGRGWIALALVVFASWLPFRLMIGAYLFGGITILQLHAQATGLGIPSQLMTSAPYLATIIVLVAISWMRGRVGSPSPASL